MHFCGDDPRPIGSRCGSECVEPHGNQSHCSVCHRTFSTVGNFDRHRRGGYCLEPAGIGLEASERGIWHKPRSEAWSFPVSHDAVDGLNRGDAHLDSQTLAGGR